jgi:hypothetical protein
MIWLWNDGDDNNDDGRDDCGGMMSEEAKKRVQFRFDRRTHTRIRRLRRGVSSPQNT